MRPAVEVVAPADPAGLPLQVVPVGIGHAVDLRASSFGSPRSWQRRGHGGRPVASSDASTIVGTAGHVAGQREDERQGTAAAATATAPRERELAPPPARGAGAPVGVDARSQRDGQP